MRREALRVILFFLFLFCGNLPFVFAEDDLTFLKSLKERVPEKDASDAIRVGKIRFLGMGGYASTVPGIDDANCIVNRDLVDVIPGTGDVVSADSTQDLLKMARDYAYRYNIVIKGEFYGGPPMNCIRK